jgi:hypothetical protein
MRRALVIAVALGLACGGGAAEPVHFDGERGFEDLVAQVRLGPRPVGSEAAAATRELIEQRLRQAGWPVRRHVSPVAGPDGKPVQIVNLIATRRGERPERIWVGAHYDTKAIPGARFVGANDGASGVALLLELARSLGPKPGAFTLELVFFDGEEAFGRDITPRDGLYGSRALAAELAASGGLAELRALILVDMVADRDLNLVSDTTSAPWLRRILAEVAAASDPGALDPRGQIALVDDHTPFQEQGLADVLAIIDFSFGARVTPGPFWHTERDDLDAVAAESLNRVGELVVQVLEKVERRLLDDEDGEGAPREPGR